MVNSNIISEVIEQVGALSLSLLSEVSESASGKSLASGMLSSSLQRSTWPNGSASLYFPLHTAIGLFTFLILLLSCQFGFLYLSSSRIDAFCMDREILDLSFFALPSLVNSPGGILAALITSCPELAPELKCVIANMTAISTALGLCSDALELCSGQGRWDFHSHFANIQCYEQVLTNLFGRAFGSICSQQRL